jgi:predicted PurR-regulated permease PerM
LSVEPVVNPAASALERRRRGRNLALLVVLLAVAGLFYAIAIVKLGGHGLGAS